MPATMSSPRAVLRSRRSTSASRTPGHRPSGGGTPWPTCTDCDAASAAANTRSPPICTPASAASGRLRWPTTTRSEDRSRGRRSRRGRSMWRYADLLPAEGPRRRPGRRVHPTGEGRPARCRARSRRGVDQERHGEPPELIQGPCGIGGADQGTGVRLQGGGVRLHRQPRELGGRARPHRGCAASSSSPPTSSRARWWAPPIYGGTVVTVDGDYDEVNRLCAELGDTYPWAFVNMNVRTYYGGRLEGLALRDRRAVGVGSPTTSSSRSRAVR